MKDQYTVEINPNDDGTIDEVVLWCGRKALFHLEQLSDTNYYFNLYPSDKMEDDRSFDIFLDGDSVVIKEIM
jgi:hypothetical protein